MISIDYFFIIENKTSIDRVILLNEIISLDSKQDLITFLNKYPNLFCIPESREAMIYQTQTHSIGIDIVGGLLGRADEIRKCNLHTLSLLEYVSGKRSICSVFSEPGRGKTALLQGLCTNGITHKNGNVLTIAISFNNNTSIDIDQNLLMKCDEANRYEIAVIFRLIYHSFVIKKGMDNQFDEFIKFLGKTNRIELIKSMNLTLIVDYIRELAGLFHLRVCIDESLRISLEVNPIIPLNNIHKYISYLNNLQNNHLSIISTNLLLQPYSQAATTSGTTYTNIFLSPLNKTNCRLLIIKFAKINLNNLQTIMIKSDYQKLTNLIMFCAFMSCGIARLNELFGTVLSTFNFNTSSVTILNKWHEIFRQVINRYQSSSYLFAINPHSITSLVVGLLAYRFTPSETNELELTASDGSRLTLAMFLSKGYYSLDTKDSTLYINLLGLYSLTINENKNNNKIEFNNNDMKRSIELQSIQKLRVILCGLFDCLSQIGIGKAFEYIMAYFEQLLAFKRYHLYYNIELLYYYKKQEINWKETDIINGFGPPLFESLTEVNKQLKYDFTIIPKLDSFYKKSFPSKYDYGDNIPFNIMYFPDDSQNPGTDRYLIIGTNSLDYRIVCFQDKFSHTNQNINWQKDIIDCRTKSIRMLIEKGWIIDENDDRLLYLCRFWRYSSSMNNKTKEKLNKIKNVMIYDKDHLKSHFGYYLILIMQLYNAIIEQPEIDTSKVQIFRRIYSNKSVFHNNNEESDIEKTESNDIDIEGEVEVEKMR